MHEAQLHERNCFLNLTLSDDYLQNGSRGFAKPQRARLASVEQQEHQLKTAHTRKNRTYASERPDSLNRRELQLFTKRLNEDVRRASGKGVKYYGCGEYGDNTQRPHYHIAIFGEDFSDDRYKWKTSNGHQLWRSSRLERLWPHGSAQIGSLTFESAAYIARYIMKKITGTKADEHYRRTDEFGNDYWIEPEFNVMSRGGRTGKGIAHAWFQQYKSDVYPHDHVIARGVPSKPPRYYDELLKALEPLEHEAILAARELNPPDPRDNTRERLEVRETVTLARLNQYKRSLE